MRTLVVEDDALNLAVITKFLEMSGVTRVDTAADGAEGAEALTEGSYDFVLTDVHMPVMSGLDMIRTVAVRGRSGGLQSGFACRDLWVGSKFAASPPPLRPGTGTCGPGSRPSSPFGQYLHGCPDRLHAGGGGVGGRSCGTGPTILSALRRSRWLTCFQPHPVVPSRRPNQPPLETPSRPHTGNAGGWREGHAAETGDAVGPRGGAGGRRRRPLPLRQRRRFERKRGGGQFKYRSQRVCDGLGLASRSLYSAVVGGLISNINYHYTARRGLAVTGLPTRARRSMADWLPAIRARARSPPFKLRIHNQQHIFVDRDSTVRNPPPPQKKTRLADFHFSKTF